MAKKAVTGLSAAMLGVEEGVPDGGHRPLSVKPATPGTTPAPIALTVKVSPETYERLKLFGARRRLSNQAILLAALEEHLRREE